MSAENAAAAIEALETVLADVKEKIGSETASAKISYRIYETKTRALIEELSYLNSDFFSEIDPGPGEGEEGEGEEGR